MAKSLKEQIKESEERTRRLKNKLPLTLGKTIMNNHKIVMTNAHGDPITYKSTAKATKGQTLKRTRTIDSLNEFTNHFKVVPKVQDGLTVTYLIMLGKDAMKLYHGTNDGDFIQVDRELKHDYNATHGNDSTDNNSDDDNDNQDNSNGSQDNPDNSKGSGNDSDDQNGSDDVR